MVDTDTPGAVRARRHSRCRKGVNDRTIDEELDLVGTDTNLEVVDRSAVRSRFSDSVVRGAPDDIVNCIVVGPVLDDVGTVLGDQKVEIVLLFSLQCAAAEDQTIVVHVTARLEQGELAFERVGAGCSVGRVPDDSSGPVLT